MYFASAYSIEFYTVSVGIWTSLVVILTKIRSIELSYGINDVIIQLRFYEVQSYTSFTCEKKNTEGDILSFKFQSIYDFSYETIP